MEDYTFRIQQKANVFAAWTCPVFVPHQVLVADNDDAGRKAATTISKIVGLPAKLMQFSEDFPACFDLADDFPKSMFKQESGRCRYIDPSARLFSQIEVGHQ